MDSAEIEALVGELESRVDRLRSLYDMYFMGIERIEPLVPRKDVERRLAILRKEQIRNTGTRFRFQMIVQRYNTYITYWQRISRQIENGTYKRDIMRAQARFGVNPVRERVEESSLQSEPNRFPSSAPMIPIPDGPIEEVYELEALPDEAASLEEDLLGDIRGLPPRAPTQERFVSAVKLELDDFSDPFEELDPFPKPPKPSAPKIRLSQRTVLQDEPRDTERRIPLAPPAAAAAPPVSDPRIAAPLAPALRSMKPESRVIVTKRPSMPDPLEVAPPVPSPPPSAPRMAPPAPGGAPRVQLRGASQAPQGAAPAKPAMSAPPQPRPVPLPPQPSVPGSPQPPPRPAVSPPSQPKPARAAVPTAPRAGDLSGDRFGQIYSQYVETRRKQNEPTGAITRDALAKQLDESTARLKQKHAGKAIDFEVVVKDGRTILRPVVK